MRRSGKIDLSKFDLTAPCPACGYRIPPSELLHVDGIHIRCPKCKAEFVYITRKPQSTS